MPPSVSAGWKSESNPRFVDHKCKRPEAMLPAFCFPFRVRSWRLFSPRTWPFFAVNVLLWVGLIQCFVTAVHDIFGCIAVQHTQYNFIRATVIITALLTADAASAGRIVQPPKPDPILDGGDTHPCLAGANLASGMNVTGQPVVPADVGSAPVPLPDQVLVPLGHEQPRRGPGRVRATGPGQVGNGPYVALDGRRLTPLLDPGPCPR